MDPSGYLYSRVTSSLLLDPTALVLMHFPTPSVMTLMTSYFPSSFCFQFLFDDFQRRYRSWSLLDVRVDFGVDELQIVVDVLISILDGNDGARTRLIHALTSLLSIV